MRLIIVVALLVAVVVSYPYGPTRAPKETDGSFVSIETPKYRSSGNRELMITPELLVQLRNQFANNREAPRYLDEPDVEQPQNNKRKKHER
ncbi:unnamed protein product [Caenorhabditis bovis]|uniref:Uncharacterized protein n=1 Tax=Caenorhabditis bovis TaxID=2654633 RepID=A0A8S1FBW6_9PELO|nr:unnamed protein product [Caenorhabditis bovis]